MEKEWKSSTRQKKILFLIFLLLVMEMIFYYLLNYQENRVIKDENMLYSKTFGNTVLKFEYYDSALGQKMIVGVEKSIDQGKTFKRVTKEAITVSREAKFVFLSKTFGFSVSAPTLMKSNQYMGVRVTMDGGKTFQMSSIHYDNPDVEIMTVEKIPYYENKVLTMITSIYTLREDRNGYQNVRLKFISKDKGLTWDLIESKKES